MIGDKQEQEVGSNSTAIQAKRDVVINQTNGLSVSEVKELCLLFLKDNFPALREEARKQAELNVKKFANDLESKIAAKIEEVSFEKFTDPDVQATINDAVQASARKGEKSNSSVLIDLISERVSNSSDDFQDVVISEAVSVVPKITDKQIAYLSFIHFMTRMSLSKINHVSQMEGLSSIVLKTVSSGFNLSDAQKRHLEYSSTCSILSMMSVNIYDGWMNQLYKHLGYTDLEKFKIDLETYSPSTKILLDTFDKESKEGQVTLTSVGMAIAIANLSKSIGTLDYSIWIN